MVVLEDPLTRNARKKAESESSNVLFANNLHEDALLAATIELTVKDLFPGTEIELAFGDGDDDFPAHNLTFHMCVRIIFSRVVMAILRGRFVGRQFLEPDIVVMEEPVFVIVDEDGGRGVRCPFVTAVLLPPVRRIPTGGNARNMFPQR